MKFYWISFYLLPRVCELCQTLRAQVLNILQAITPRLQPLYNITNQLWNDDVQWFIVLFYSQCQSDELVSCLLAETLCMLHWLASQLLSSLQNSLWILKMTKGCSVLKHYLASQLYSYQILLLLGRKVLDKKILVNLFQCAKIFSSNFVLYGIYYAYIIG